MPMHLLGPAPSSDGKQSLLGIDGKPLRAPPAAQQLAKDLVLGLAGMPSFRVALKMANDALRLRNQLANRGQRITLHLLSTAARWQEEAQALVREYTTTDDEAAPESLPAEERLQPASPAVPCSSLEPASSGDAAPPP